MKNNARLKGFVLAITAAIFWGISGACCQFLFTRRGISAEWLVTVRMLVSGAILLLIAAIKQEKALITAWHNRKDGLSLVYFGLLGVLAVQYTYFAAIKYSNAATATVLQYAGPVLIAVYLALQKRQWPRAIDCLAILLAVTGTFLLVTHGSFRSLSISGLALFWGLASAMAMAFYSLQPARLLTKYPSTVVIGWGMIIGGVALSFLHAPWKVQGQWDVYSYLFTAFIILLASLFAFYAYLTAVKLIGAQSASLLASAEPFSAAVISIVWLHISFGVMDWLGSLCIISTIFLLTYKKKKSETVIHA